MKFIEVDKLPCKDHQKPKQRHDVLSFLKNFIESEIKIAKVIFDDGDYVHLNSARAALSERVWHYKLHNVQVISRNNEIYLMRTDL